MAHNQDKLRQGRVSQHASLVRRWQRARGHEVVLVHLAQKCRLHVVACIMLHKFECFGPRPPDGTCLLLTLQLMKSPETPANVNLVPYYFPGGPYDTLLLPIYVEHVDRHVWEGEILLYFIWFILIELRLMLVYLFLQEHEMVKSINHARKILNLDQNADAWFQDCVRYSGLAGLCSTRYMIVNHGMFVTFVERWHKDTSFFHFPHGEMSTTLGDVSCLLHLPIRGRLLNHSWIDKFEN